MKRIALFILGLILLTSLFACVQSDNAKEDTTKKETTAAEITTEPETTDKQTTMEETTAVVTTIPETTTLVTTPPPVVTSPPQTTALQPPVQPPVQAGSITVTYPVSSIGYTHTGLPALPAVEYTVNDPYNARGLQTARNGFSYGVASGGSPHSITVNNQATFDSYGTNALAWDNKTGTKVLYLTFDCGYKYADLTTRILNTLKEKNVKAAFFCTMDYLKADPSEVARMINEGHTVGNHSVTHPDCTTISREKLAWELLGIHNYMRVNFGYSPKYFRFPTGAYSQNALELCSSLGYRSVFWSVAYADWDPANQQGTESAYSQVTSRLHPGAVILLHSTSPDNASILGRVIDYARANGYEFRTLDSYGYWK